MTKNINDINYNEILQLIKSQLLSIMEENYSYYQDYKIYIAEEQFFVKPVQVDPKAIYVILKFFPISVHFGQTVLPAQIIVISEQNNIEVCRELFTELVTIHNLGQSEDETIQQIYESPVVMSHFDKVMSGYRNVIRVSATFIISKNANFYKYYYIYKNENGDEKEYEIPCVTKAFAGNIQLDTQPFFGSNNLTKSKSKVYTLNYSIVTFLLTDIPLANDVLDVMCKNRSISESFNIKIKFKNGKELNDEFYLVSWDSRTDIGQIPMLVLSFVN